MLTMPEAKKIVSDLWKNKNQKDFLVPLDETENCINSYVEKYHKQQWLPDSMLDDCYQKFDGPFFKELKSSRVIKEFSFGEGELPNTPPGSSCQTAQISSVNIPQLIKLREWINQIPYIKSHGEFSLNTISGELYFRDDVVVLYKKAGHFQLLKAFLENKDFSLSADEIIQITNASTQNRGTNYDIALEVIKNLGRRLGLRKNLHKVISYNGNHFVLVG